MLRGPINEWWKDTKKYAIRYTWTLFELQLLVIYCPTETRRVDFERRRNFCQYLLRSERFETKLMK